MNLKTILFLVVLVNATLPLKSETFTSFYTKSVERQFSSVINKAKATTNESISFDMMSAGTYNNFVGLVKDCADPYILKYNGKYYLYGTGGSDGIKVYQSDDMATWSKAVGVSSGYALHKNLVWGEKWFWAPEVYYLNGKFYMFYSAEEKISVAESVSPLGPFTQAADKQKPFHENIKEIDTHLFIDDNGKKYLYFVRFTNGNEIWVAELNDDMYSIKETTIKRCIGATVGLQAWEKSTAEPQPNAKVNEGPFVLKRNGWYYLTYSANHYENPNYGVGYAFSKSPLGPWTKYAGNPILIGNSQIKGVGHHSFINTSDKCQYIVYHSHNSMTAVQPRKLAIDRYEFVASTSTNSPDILKVYGPTTTVQTMCEETTDVDIINESVDVIRLYPNPAQSQFTLELDANQNSSIISIYNANGEIVFNKRLINSNKVVVDSRNFSVGAYLVKVSQDNKIHTKKLIIN